jgi:hypothetical protein
MKYEPAKTKAPQKATPSVVQGRDLFQTPAYAVDLLIPFIPEYIDCIWEPACGEGKIVQRLTERGYSVFPSDIRKAEGWVNNIIYNFLLGDETGTLPYPVWEDFQTRKVAIVTNPPFSLKPRFYYKCLEYRVPFALLIPADYSGWIIQACIDGAEKIVPTRRIDYITPNILTRIHEAEVYNAWLAKEGKNKDNITLLNLKQYHPAAWQTILNSYSELHNYKNLEEVPQELLHKYSSSDFHSMWLTWGFGLGVTETFVELFLKEKKENI